MLKDRIVISPFKRDLNAKVKGAELFTYNELIYDKMAISNGIENQPTEEKWKFLEGLFKYIMMPVAKQFGKPEIVSCFRNPKLNKIRGKFTRSDHIKGYAVDFTYNNIDLYKVFDWIYKGNYKFTNMRLENGYIHISVNPKTLERDLWVNGNRVTYDEFKLMFKIDNSPTNVPERINEPKPITSSFDEDDTI